MSIILGTIVKRVCEWGKWSIIDMIDNAIQCNTCNEPLQTYHAAQYLSLRWRSHSCSRLLPVSCDGGGEEGAASPPDKRGSRIKRLCRMSRVLVLHFFGSQFKWKTLLGFFLFFDFLFSPFTPFYCFFFFTFLSFFFCHFFWKEKGLCMLRIKFTKCMNHVK